MSCCALISICALYMWSQEDLSIVCPCMYVAFCYGHSCICTVRTCIHTHTYVCIYSFWLLHPPPPPPTHTHAHPYLPFPWPDLFQSDPQQLNKIAKELIGSVCYVGWPHLVEAKVVAVSTSTTKWVLWNTTQASLWGECMHTNVCLMNNCTVCTCISGLCLHRQTLVWHPAYIHTYSMDLITMFSTFKLYK